MASMAAGSGRSKAKSGKVPTPETLLGMEEVRGSIPLRSTQPQLGTPHGAFFHSWIQSGGPPPTTSPCRDRISLSCRLTRSTSWKRLVVSASDRHHRQGVLIDSSGSVQRAADGNHKRVHIERLVQVREGLRSTRLLRGTTIRSNDENREVVPVRLPQPR